MKSQPPSIEWLRLRTGRPGERLSARSYLGVLAAGFAREYFHRYQARWRDTVRLQSHAAELQAQLAEDRLTGLERRAIGDGLVDPPGLIAKLAGEFVLGNNPGTDFIGDLGAPVYAAAAGRGSAAGAPGSRDPPRR